MATDFFTLDTLAFKRLSSSSSLSWGVDVWITGVTERPHRSLVTQQARNVTADLDDADIHVKFVLRDRDTKYVDGFDQVFESEGAKVVMMPYRTPNANAVAERFARRCLDHLLVVNRRPP